MGRITHLSCLVLAAALVAMVGTVVVERNFHFGLAIAASPKWFNNLKHRKSELEPIAKGRNRKATP